MTQLSRSSADAAVVRSRPLAQLILMVGNYLNGNSYAGGAFGFKIASINKVRLLTGDNAPSAAER